MPWSVAIARVRSACHGSVTTTAVDHPSDFICRLDRGHAAQRVAAGRRPPRLVGGHAVLGQPDLAGRRLGEPVARALAAHGDDARRDVVLHRSRACTRRAVNTEDGRPSNWAAPSTTIASETRRSSWRANHQTRPAVTTSTSRTRTSRATAALRASRSAIKRSPAVAAVRHERGATGLQPRHRDAERRAGDVVEPHVVEEVHRRRGRRRARRRRRA